MLYTAYLRICKHAHMRIYSHIFRNMNLEIYENTKLLLTLEFNARGLNLYSC